MRRRLHFAVAAPRGAASPAGADAAASPPPPSAHAAHAPGLPPLLHPPRPPPPPPPDRPIDMLPEDLAALGAAVVCDWGGGYVKAGLSSREAPMMIPALVGLPLETSERAYRGPLVGDMAVRRRANLRLCSPVVRGELVSISDLDLLMHYTFYEEMRVAPEEHPHVYGVPLLAEVRQVAQIAELAFETHNAPSLFVARDAGLAVLGSGRLTGVAVSIGAGLTAAVPVYEGQPLMRAVMSIPLAGADITEYLSQLLQRRGLHVGRDAQESLRAAKEALVVTYDHTDSAEDCSTVPFGDTTLTLPSAVRRQCPELLFDPSLLRLDHCAPLPRLVAQAIRRCDAALQEHLWDNVVLYGGTAQLPGLASRLHKELSKHAPPGVNLRIISTPAPAALPWHGGAVLAATAEFPHMCALQGHWMEEGRERCMRRFLL